MNASKIPDELKSRRQWVLWKNSERNGEPTKLPHQISGSLAKSNDPATWCSFEEALGKVGEYDGLGFMFSADDAYVGIDLDGCRNPETGVVSEWAKEIISRLDSYTEISPSKTGVKIFIRGESPFPSGKKSLVKALMVCSKAPAIEVYDKLRYFAVTGWRVAGVSASVEERTDVLLWLKSKYFQEAPVVKSLPDANARVLQRARKYLEKIPPAVSGQGGHNQTFHAACVLVLGFGLSESEAFALLSEWNQSCLPPWSEKELWHKVRSASQRGGERNYLRDVEPREWDRVQVPAYKSQNDKPEDYPELKTLEKSVGDYIAAVNSPEQLLISLGINELDHAIGGGVAPGELVVLAARPSHGKSAVAMQILHHVTSLCVPTLIVSEEMPALALGKRTLQFASEVPEQYWQHYTEDLRVHAENFFEKRAHCYIAESCGTVAKAEEVIRWAVAEKGVKVVAVDYAQLLRSPGSSRYEQVTNTSIAIRQLASELGVTILLLCQLNREMEKRGKFLPMMSDLRDSGQIEQDADVILFLCWPYRIDSTRDPYEYLIFVGKNRNRPINKSVINCKFMAARQMLQEEEKPTKSYTEFDQWNNRD